MGNIVREILDCLLLAEYFSLSRSRKQATSSGYLSVRSSCTIRDCIWGGASKAPRKATDDSREYPSEADSKAHVVTLSRNLIDYRRTTAYGIRPCELDQLVAALLSAKHLELVDLSRDAEQQLLQSPKTPRVRDMS